jgi:hypothetical protein
MASGTVTATELSLDLFQAFYTDGILRDSSGDIVLDENGNPVHDGWVTAIGPFEAQESSSLDIFTSYGGINSGILNAVEVVTKDTFSSVGNVSSTSAFAAIEGSIDHYSSFGRVYFSSSIFNALETSLDQLAIEGTVTVNSGSLSATDSLDVLAIEGNISSGIAGSLEVTDSADTYEAAGTVSSNSSVFEGIELSDSWESAGTVQATLVGNLSSTELSVDTFSVEGNVTVNTGSLTVLESLDISNISGTVKRKIGSLSALEVKDTYFSSGNISDIANLGILNAPELPDFFTSSGLVTLVKASVESTTLPINRIYSIKSLTTNQVHDVEEVIFLNRDNSILLQLLGNDLPANLYSVTKVSLVSNVNNLEINSVLNPEMFDWSGGNGELILDLSTLDIDPEFHHFYLILYDDYFVHGLVWDMLSINFVKTFN